HRAPGPDRAGRARVLRGSREIPIEGVAGQRDSPPDHTRHPRPPRLRPPARPGHQGERGAGRSALVAPRPFLTIGAATAQTVQAVPMDRYSTIRWLIFLSG